MAVATLPSPDNFSQSGRRVAKPSSEHTPLDGFVSNGHRAMQKTADHDEPRFQIVCSVCGGLGIVFDENPPVTATIVCRHCGAPRGTLEALREFSTSSEHDQFEL